jgi:subtilisin family serine protease
MKVKWLMYFLMVTVLCGVAITDASEVKEINIPFRAVPSEVRYVPDEFIVVLSQGVGTPKETNYLQSAQSGIRSLDLLAGSYQVEYMKPLFPGAAERGIAILSRHYKVKFSGSHDLQTVMDAYATDPAIEHVEPDGIHPEDAVPNDGNYSEQWHLNQVSDHDVDAPEAWDIETGDSTIIVAILDSGVRYYHRDLGGVNASSSNPGAARGNMWINWAEKNGTAGVDDDSNGYTDDWIGYDFVESNDPNCWPGEDCATKDNDPRDFNGHGTHCAGNVGAINNNGYATCAPSGGWGNGSLEEYGNGVKIMACRVGRSLDVGGEERMYVRMSFCAEAFYYAADNGAKIASCSWGSSNTGGIDVAATYFTSNGGLIFKSAGNNDDEVPTYLSTRADVISVAATDKSDCKASFSCYGTWVDISAPGVSIRSSYHWNEFPDNDYVAYKSGTSMAAPLAASVAALIWSVHPGWTAAQIEQHLYDTADDIEGLACNSTYVGKLGAGRVNAYNAVLCDVTAEFTADQTRICAPDSICFTDLSTGPVISWDWDFGDGGTSTDQHPCYEYTIPGTYPVSLTVTSAICSDTETKVNYITVDSLVPVCQIQPASLDFGSVEMFDSLDMNFTIYNIGCDTLSGAVSESHDQFSIHSGTGPYALAPGESLLVTVRYAPDELGFHWTNITTGTARCSNVYCSGTSTEPPPVCSIVPDTLDYGIVSVGGFKIMSFDITNTGYGTLDGNVSASCTYYNITIGAGAYSLTHDQTHSVSIIYFPAAAGTHTCTIETGNGICSDVFCTGMGGSPPVCSVDPDTLDFGTVLVGNYEDSTFAITNTGGDTLSGTVEELCAHYSIISGGGSYALAQDETLFVTVRFEPTVSGNHECTVETGAAICSDVFCSGAGDLPAACLVDPDTLDFGTVLVGSNKDSTFTITNTGGDTLSGNVSEACDHYSIIAGAGAYNLSAAQSHVVTVRFEPGTPGTHECTVETGSGLCSDVFCSGVGELPAACLVDPDTLDFGVVTVGDSTEAMFFVTNTGGEILNGSISETCDAYSIVSGGGAYALASDETLFVTIRFKPGSAGLHSCTVETGSGLCSDVYCSGTGDILPVCLVEPDSLDFGTVNLGDSLDMNFLITNTGGGVLSGSLSDTCSYYSIVAGGGSYNLSANETLQVVVRYKPEAEALHDCAIETGVALCSDVYCSGSCVDVSGTAVVSLERLHLYQNYPNPFNPVTRISFTLPDRIYVNLAVFNLEGKLVATLVNEILGKGLHDARWDATDSHGNPVSSGVYFYRLKAGGKVQTRKLVLVR